MSEKPKRMWSRRQFLAWGTGGVLTLFLRACGIRPQRPTPSPTPTATSTPTSSPTATPEDHQAYLPHLAADGEHPPSPIASPSPSPTHTPTATPTDTPTPEPAAPTPTPFPPGAPSKLGVFVAYNHPQLFDLLRTGNVALVKTLEVDPAFLAAIKGTAPRTLVVARLAPLEDVDWMKVNPTQLARNFVQRLLPLATDPRRQPYIDAWEAYNEPVAEQPESMKRLADFEAERTYLLAQHGIRSCVGNFSTGHPKLELWPHFYPALHAVQEHGGFLGLHEYSAPYMWFGTGPYQLRPGQDEGDEGWLTLRYRKVYRHYLKPANLAVPLLITETGIDGAVQPRPGPKGDGWKDFIAFWRQEGRITTTPEGFYMEQLVWYDTELQKDPYVLGAAIYALVVFGQPSFEIVGPCAALLRQYLAVHPPHG